MRITYAISPEELRRWCKPDDWQGTRLVAANWAMIAAIFAGVALWTNPVSIALGIALLGGRQLGLAVLMHECGHRTLFANRRANVWVGQWLCAHPILTDMERYAAGHIEHHRYAGSKRDPDLGNYQAYPIGRDSFRRKILRDLTGRTGFRLLAGRFRNDDALFGSQLGSSGTGGFIVVSLIMFAALHAFGHGALYWMWPAAFLTSYLLFARLRQIAEHGGVPDLFDPDPRRHTRTTIACWWERLFVAPNFVNFHLEHHLAAAVPCYRLRDFHALLLERHVYEHTRFPASYGAVLRSVTTPA
ncbi:MAG: fatty acid desaturase family protein [Deltaproteobacteria bacterium]|nr:fatty acid desaturase family protein [Deltaproteobacteria bacterium]MBW2664882.1 fatty acid desaturase family protein [Deltaproteobacteria bacterium]